MSKYSETHQRIVIIVLEVIVYNDDHYVLIVLTMAVL